jgi:dipeptidyl aminopeptidase/acylaminoacyl peptidase
MLMLPLVFHGQKKILDHADYDVWNTIQNEAIAPNGKFLLYSLERGEKDQFLKVKDTKGNLILTHDRGEQGQFSYDSNHVIFTIKAWKDSVIALKKRKVKKEELPKDSLGIFDIKERKLEKIAHVKSYKLPKKWSGYVAYQLEEIKPIKKEENDTLTEKTKEKEKPKKVSKENGYHLVLRNLKDHREDTLHFVTDYLFAEEGKMLAYTTTGTTKEDNSSVFVLDLETATRTKLHEAKKAKYFQLAFSPTGKKLGFVVDADTTKVQLRPNALYFWKKGNDRAMKLVDNSTAPNNYVVSKYGDVHFSEDESNLFFGLAKPPIEKDTSLLDEEIVNVEVWTYNEPELYTVQEMKLKNDTIRSYKTIVDLEKNTIVPLASPEYPNIELGEKGNAPYALVNTSKPYELESQWTARRDYDYKVVNTSNGELLLKLTKVPRMRLSPKALYGFGYSRVDSTWFTYDLQTGNYRALTKNKVFYDEENDSPDFPRPYGIAGWSKEDASLLLYDRYDIWQLNPKTGAIERMTNGREAKTVYRYIQLDPEEEFIELNNKLLLSSFNEVTKDGGYAELNTKNKTVKELMSGPYRFSNPKKALFDNNLMYTKESFERFPDLLLSSLDFKKSIAISQANPQQEQYNWGTAELVQWISLDGKELTGMLIKPENFDKNKKYPLLVNFYEKSSDGIHRHRYPKAERSTINYSFYASRGYIIFNPDVHYRIGYPGESAYNCVIPGITSLVEKGFIDKDNIGVQGHSWGGYQIAYLVTKTDIFKAAEAGAPVPNMVSAYGGIRWWTGLSRQFQYEHTQSRIGGTPWEYPSRYIENSPIFNIDKINTPLLIMHNDADGHVPWYQGIEFFVSLRRLGKPSWFLNYNGEPHWPLKHQNRLDFSIRMAQFFDHYLKGDALPSWMERGVPPMEKGVKMGYEPAKDTRKK